MKIEFKIKGITLNVNDLVVINQYYEAACTAEYIMENYNITDENEAMQLGYDVHNLIGKYGYDEEEAIYEVIKRRNKQ